MKKTRNVKQRHLERQMIERAILRLCRALYNPGQETTLCPAAQAQILGLEAARRRVA